MSSSRRSSRRLSIAIRSALLLPAAVISAPAVQAQATGSEVRGLALEEIVVTARKREESLQEVPIAVTAFSETQLESFDMRSLEDIALRTPGLQFSQQAGQIAGRYNCSIRFRGMNVNSEQAVYQLGAMFVDGIYVASGCSSIAAEDLQRVEVVKGPQAVYFGRNTFGGAVNYVTKDPGNEWGAKVTASIAEDDEYDYTGSFEGPIVTDKAAFRVTGRYYDRGGIFESNSGDQLGEEKTRSVSAKIVINPTEDLAIRLRGYYGEDRDGPSAGGYISGNLNDTCKGTFGPNGEVRDRYICGEIPGINSAITDNNGSLISYNTSLSPSSFTAPDYLRTQLLENGVNDPANERALAFDYFGLKRNTFYFGATLDWTLPNDWVLSGVYGHNEMKANWLRDFDFTDVESWWSTDPQNLDDDTYEIRLTSDDEGAFSWVAGASWYEMDYLQSGNGGTAVTAFPFALSPTGFIPLPFNNSQVNNTKQEYTAFFGGVTWRMTDQWSLSVEGRYQKDKLTRGQFIAEQIGQTPVSEEWEDWLPRVILQWQPTPETNIYASYSVGVLPGDINAELIFGPDNMRTEEQVASARDQAVNGTDPYPDLGIPNGTPGIAQAADFLDREKLDSYEIGWKQQWLDGALSTAIAIYYMEWENQKGRVSAALVDYNGNTDAPFVRDDPSCTTHVSTDLVCNDTLRTIQLQIAGSSELKGIEFEGTWIATDNLTLQAGFEYTDNEYTDFIFNFVEALAGTIQMKGNTQPRYPEYKGNLALTWNAPLGGTGWEWFTRWDLIYFGKYYVDESNLAEAPDQTLLEARVGVNNENWRVELFGKNLTDEDAYAAAGRWSDFSIPGNFAFGANQGVVVTPQRERYFGVKLAYQF